MSNDYVYDYNKLGTDTVKNHMNNILNTEIVNKKLNTDDSIKQFYDWIKQLYNNEIKRNNNLQIMGEVIKILNKFIQNNTNEPNAFITYLNYYKRDLETININIKKKVEDKESLINDFSTNLTSMYDTFNYTEIYKNDKSNELMKNLNELSIKIIDKNTYVEYVKYLTHQKVDNNETYEYVLFFTDIHDITTLKGYFAIKIKGDKNVNKIINYNFNQNDMDTIKKTYNKDVKNSSEKK